MINLNKTNPRLFFTANHDSPRNSLFYNRKASRSTERKRLIARCVKKNYIIATIAITTKRPREVSEFSLCHHLSRTPALSFLSYFDNFFHRISFRFIWRDDLFSRPPHKVSIRCLNGWQATHPYCRLNYYLTPESYNGQQGALEGPGTFQPDGQITVEIKFLIPAIFQVMLPDPSSQPLSSSHLSRELWPHLNGISSRRIQILMIIITLRLIGNIVKSFGFSIHRSSSLPSHLSFSY